MTEVLRRVNPLAKYGAVLPVFVAVILSKGLALPAGIALASVLVLLSCSRQPLRIAVWVVLGLPLLAATFMMSLAVWTPAPPTEAPLFALGPLSWSPTAMLTAAATGARIAAILALALMVGLTTDTRALVRAAVQNLRLPYRIGYAALIAFEFVPHLRTEFQTIRLAHRARYAAVAASRRFELRRVLGGLTIPIAIFAGGIRHAERVAVSMETRSFGLHERRTERAQEPFLRSDWLWFIGLLALYAAVIGFTLRTS